MYKGPSSKRTAISEMYPSRSMTNTWSRWPYWGLLNGIISEMTICWFQNGRNMLININSMLFMDSDWTDSGKWPDIINSINLRFLWTITGQSMKNPVCRQPYMCLSVGEAVIADKETALIKIAGMLRLWTERWIRNSGLLTGHSIMQPFMIWIWRARTVRRWRCPIISTTMNGTVCYRLTPLSSVSILMYTAVSTCGIIKEPTKLSWWIFMEAIIMSIRKAVKM